MDKKSYMKNCDLNGGSNNSQSRVSASDPPASPSLDIVGVGVRARLVVLDVVGAGRLRP